MVGRGRNRGPCPACNSAAGGAGDRIVGAGQRLVDGILGRRLDVEGRQQTSRPHRLGTESTTTRAPRKKKTAARKKPTTTPARPLMPACEKCGTRSPLNVTSRGAVCADGCPAKEN
ncbi:hypothetical protein KBI5_22230 [Frankia sp. KB5]|nr:hypothetical protein KBI5_22230 [Frankia sp. KB5]